MDTPTPKKKKMTKKSTKKKKKKKVKKDITTESSEIAKQQKSQDFAIAPSAAGPTLKTSDWPLLLKNFDKLNIRTGHYTPIPAGKYATIVAHVIYDISFVPISYYSYFCEIICAVFFIVYWCWMFAGSSPLKRTLHDYGRDSDPVITVDAVSN